MKRLFVVFTLLFFAPSAQLAGAVTVWYQPTPYPAKQADDTTMPQDITIVHAWEGGFPTSITAILSRGYPPFKWAVQATTN